MTCIIREMREQESAQVVDMVRELARDTVAGVVPKLTADGLLAARDLIDVVVAVDEGRILGACLGLITFSTWRGARGLYIVDLFVGRQSRRQNIGLRLLRQSARCAAEKGARFVKLEVDEGNEAAARFYTRLGFGKKSSDRLFILEQDRLTEFIATGDAT